MRNGAGQVRIGILSFCALNWGKIYRAVFTPDHSFAERFFLNSSIRFSFLLKNGGTHLTKAQQRQLNREQNRVSHKIYKDKQSNKK